MKRAAELAFLDELLRVDIDRFHSASWLKSEFEEMLWRCEFGRSGSFNIDFNIPLPSGRLLSRTPKLIYLFKLWLTFSTSGEFTGTLGASPAVHYGTVNGVLAWLDYFLLNVDEFDIERAGLSEVTRDGFRGALNQLCSNRNKAIALYDWERKAIAYLKARVGEVTEWNINETLGDHPTLAEVDETELKKYGALSASDVTSMRVWLQINGYFRNSSGHRYCLNSRKLSVKLYSATLRGVAAQKPSIDLFSVGKYRSKGREFGAVMTTRKGDLAEGLSLSQGQYMRSFQALENLHLQEICLDLLPSPAVIALASINVPGRSDGRFKTVPTKVVFQALRVSIEYQLQYGDALVDSYLRLIRLAHSIGTTVGGLSRSEFDNCLDPRIAPLGVSCWAFSTRQRNSKGHFLQNSDIACDLTPNFCSSIHHCLKILYGAAEIIVGTLMARREGELISLDVGKALDITQTYLVFQNEKSTKMMLGQRTIEARPIASIAARTIINIERISEELKSLGYLTGSVKLFQSPAVSCSTNLLGAYPHTLYDDMDALCDYAELPLVNGKRYYIRQHQLRRFFCMVFFWHRSFDGLDTLRWFLGQQDIEHVYRYITESTPGSVLISVKAQHAAENIASYENLSTLLKERFGAAEFALLDSQELEDHIQSLIEEGCLSVEPEFYKDSNGTDYRILVKVK